MAVMIAAPRLARYHRSDYCAAVAVHLLRDPDAPVPSANRSHAYRHSFEVGRAEITGRPIPAHLSRAWYERDIDRWVADPMGWFRETDSVASKRMSSGE